MQTPMRASSAAATSSGAAVHAAAAVAAASVDRPPLNLLAELPSHTEALEQQRINLLRFVADNPAVFAEMPYEPFTHAPRRSSPLQFEIRPAGPPLCGLQGVFSLQDVPAKDKEQEAMFYSGLLIPGPSYESFCNQYYCPTGLELPALTYKDRASGANVKVLVIGDPTGLAAIINDGVFGRTESAVNCKLQSVRKDHLKSIVTQGKNGKQRVSAEVAAVWTLADVPLSRGQELLLDYGGQGFWRILTEDEHCVACFSRAEEDVDNPLVLCDNEQCRVARHRLCLPCPPSLEQLQVVSYFCPEHMPLADRPLRCPTTPSAVRPKAPLYSPPPAHAPMSPAAPLVRRPAAPIYSPEPSVSSLPAPSVRRPAAPVYSPVPANDYPASMPAACARRAAAAAASSVAAAVDVRPMDRPAPIEASSSAAVTRPSAQRVINFGSIGVVSGACSDRVVSDPSAMSDSGGQFYSEPSRPARRSSSDHDSSDFSSLHSSDGSSSSGAETGSDSDNQQVSCSQRSMGHRSTGLRLFPGDGESVASLHELGSATSTVQRASLSIRTKDKIEKLPQFQLYSPCNSGAWILCWAEYTKYAEMGKKRPWFVREEDAKPFLATPRPRKPNASAAASSESVFSRSDDVVVAAGSASVAGGSMLNSDAVARLQVSVTTNRWLNQQDVQNDFAEFRCCCGVPDKWTAQLARAGLGPDAYAEHPSVSVMLFFRSRILHRNGFAGKIAYQQHVASELKLGTPRWQGLSVCCSCFRACLGISRSMIFKYLGAMTSSAHEIAPQLTQAGFLKVKRRANKRDLAVSLLRDFCRKQGQHRPNPKGSDVNKCSYRLPQRVMKELARALAEFQQQQHQLPSLPDQLSAGAIRRGRRWLEVEDNVWFTLGKGTTLVRCGECDKLDNQCTPKYLKENGKGDKDKLMYQLAKQSHLAQMQGQRDDFDSHKDKATAKPLEEWCITMDGMDQAKTQLPSKARYSKVLEPEARIKLHWMGVFCFGGPVPALGLMNTPELRKDSSLSIMTLMRVLDVQFCRLEENCNRAVAGSQAASHADQDAAAAAAVPALADSSTADSSSPKYCGPGLNWPRRLHITFDNAAGESKNQWMMRFLGLLVFHGVFEAITLSMLLVGHTHDIVDQMFSVWARLLRINDAETYEKMRDLFRTKYHTRIQGLVDLMRGQAEALNALGPEEQQAVHDLPDEFNEGQAKIFSEFTEFARVHSLLEPHIDQQTDSVDIQGWIQQAVAPGSKLPPLTHIDKAYNYGIERDKAGNVYLYSRQYANSTERGDPQAVHNFLHQPTGRYTTRAILWKATDPGAHVDPYRLPPLPVDTASLHKTLRAFKDNAAMGVEEQKQFTAMLERLEEGQKQQGKDCSVCFGKLVAYGRHGVVHRPRGATEGELKEASQKQTSRQHAWRAMQKHLRDPAFAAVHDATMRHSGWWTQWLDRVQHHIQPGYFERGIRTNLTVAAEPYHAAATELCSGEGEQPVHLDRAARVDLTNLKNRGAPKVGQTVILRSQSIREPFYLGTITAVRPSQRALKKSETAVARVEESGSNPSAIDSAAAASAPATAASSSEAHFRDLKDIDVAVRYYDLAPASFKDIHLSALSTRAAQQKVNTEWWARQFADHGQDEDALQEALDKAIQGRVRRPPARSGWLVDLYRPLRFLETAQKQEEERTEPDWIHGATLVVWGERSKLLKFAPNFMINDATWRLLREDLTEQKEDRSASTQKQPSAKPKGGKRKVGRAQDDEEEEEKESAAAPLASSAAPSRPAAAAAADRPVRGSRNPNPVTDAMHDDDQEDAAHMSSCSSSDDAADDDEGHPGEDDEEGEEQVSAAPKRHRTK